MPIRINGLDSVNAAPLQHGLQRLERQDAGAVRLTLSTPAASAAALANRQTDVALIPSIELQQIAGARMVPGICVAARRRVRSVLLLTRREPQDLESVAVDSTSRTSVALLRILLARVFDVRPRFVEHPPAAEAMLAAHDGALLIADAALQADIRRWRSYDLAELWADWTGLPFVFAVWAAREPLNDEAGLIEMLVRSRMEGLEQLPHLVAELATRRGNPGGPALTAYLTELLHYTLGPSEEASLSRFFTEAHGLGLIPQPAPLTYLGGETASPRAAAGGSL